MIRVVSWNVAGRNAPWETLLAMDADIALLQEAGPPALELIPGVEIDPSPWHTAGAGLNRSWKAAVVKLSDRVQVEWIEGEFMTDGEWDGFSISRPGYMTPVPVFSRDLARGMEENP